MRWFTSRWISSLSTLAGLPLVALCVISLLSGFLPHAVLAGEIQVTSFDLKQEEPGRWSATDLPVPAPDRALPIVADQQDDPALNLLRRLEVRGLANGFQGVLYDNRDRAHSALDPDLFPRLNRITYGESLQGRGMDFGLAGAILFPAIVFGNSSTAVTAGPVPRSLPRLSMTAAQGPETAARLYTNNHLYIYPEHRDYDETDQLPAHWPYHLVSQGSSGSDQPFLRAIAATLAAFPEETLTYMQENGTVAPVLQMILRRNLRPVNSWEDYTGGLAHRPVIDGANLRPARMVAQAAAIRPEDVPPVAQISVVEEDFHAAAGLAGQSERLFDTPSAVARVWRGFEGVKRMAVSAGDTRDPMGRPLTFTWALLQGNPDRVQIRPRGEDGREAQITIVWHDPFEAPVFSGEGLRTIRTSRVDIGLFASTGEVRSAPAILSVSFPAHQQRDYGKSNTGGLRLTRIDYDAAGRGAYYDPEVHWSAPWADTAEYDVAGVRTGWQRRYSDPGRADATVPVAVEDTAYRMREGDGPPVLADREVDAETEPSD